MVGRVTCVFLICWSQHKVLGPEVAIALSCWLYFALSHSSGVSPLCLPPIWWLLFWNSNYFARCSSLFWTATRMNSLFSRRLRCRRTCCARKCFLLNSLQQKRTGEKITISLIPFPVSSPFCVFVLIPCCAMVLPTQRCCGQVAPLHCAAGLFLNLHSYKHG